MSNKRRSGRSERARLIKRLEDKYHAKLNHRQRFVDIARFRHL